jgi:3'(2'), 5'-bisphosphate nucleotidase
MSEFYQTNHFISSMKSLMNECNEAVLKYYNNEIEVFNKDDNSPVTLADQHCNKIICNHLREVNRFFNKDILIISEENKKIDYEGRKKYSLCWLVDPLDGTKEFINGKTDFTVNIGLCFNGIPVFGIVSVPVKNEIYYGANGLGSFKLTNNKSEKVLFIKDKDFNKNGVKIVSSFSHSNKATETFIKKYYKPQTLSVGSSVKFLKIADNEADIYPRMGPTMEWDTCAAHSVVKYAGGNVVDYSNDYELVYNKSSLYNPFFICY